MKKNEIKGLLNTYPDEDVEVYINHLEKIESEKDKKTGNKKNTWITYRSSKELADCYKAVARDGMRFDGVNITLIKTGVSYNYQAYKNKMYMSYPETVIDTQLVREGDMYDFRKVDGHVHYNHTISDPFGNSMVSGAYCVIKNKRGEFLTLLSKDDIEKHRKVAKTDYIWRAWFDEMAKKTVIKKACSLHFRDIYQNIENLDNENYDLENSLELDVETKTDIENLETVEDTKKYYEEKKGEVENIKALVKALAGRKAQILEGF